MDHPDPITHVLQEGVHSGVFPGAVLYVRHQGRLRIHRAIGQLSCYPDSPAVQTQTIYDLASLTKPLATVSSVLLLVQEGSLQLEQPLETIISETKGFPLGEVSLKELLSHQSGLPAWKPLYQTFSPVFTEEPEFRQQRVQAILGMILQEPIEQLPNISVYSDLGYIVLGFVVERVAGRSLAAFSQERIFSPLRADHLTFGLEKGSRKPVRADCANGRRSLARAVAARRSA